MKQQPKLILRLECVNLPGIRFEDFHPVYLGIQKGKNAVALVPGDRERALFDAAFRIGRTKDGAPNFLGPFGHGSPARRFIYLTWGEWDGVNFRMFRRAKIFLDSLTWPAIHSAINQGRPIEARISMTDAKGGPLCATVQATHLTWKIPK